jgi:hypothetical protein
MEHRPETVTLNDEEGVKTADEAVAILEEQLTRWQKNLTP